MSSDIKVQNNKELILSVKPYFYTILFCLGIAVIGLYTVVHVKSSHNGTLLGGEALIIIGLVFAAISTRFYKLIINKHDNELIVKRMSIIPHTKKCQVSDISEFNVYMTGGKGTNYRVIFKTKENKKLKFSTFSSMYSYDDTKANLADISKFINVPVDYKHGIFKKK